MVYDLTKVKTNVINKIIQAFNVDNNLAIHLGITSHFF
ncbi:hypothetical protein VRK_12950 [Vibrio sp. MEBiC08052]|nr:hypothetical protein VRK_12950 [Vibrio sp. MEBiC08052]